MSNAQVEIQAKLNYLHLSPRKVRLVANLIKGMELKRARLQLAHLPKRASAPLLKLLKSAAANAKNNFQLDESGLYVKNILVNEGPTFKRYRPRAFGRAAMIRKRTSHVILTLEALTVSKKSPPHKKKEGPLIREALPEEVKAAGPLVKDEWNIRNAERPKRKAADFVRRMFRRKAI